MKFISELQEGSRIQDVYLCKHKTRSGTSTRSTISMSAVR